MPKMRMQVRFMIMAEHELCEQTVVGADQEAFNSHLNLEQVNKVRAALGALAALLMVNPKPCEPLCVHRRSSAACVLCCALADNFTS